MCCRDSEINLEPASSHGRARNQAQGSGRDRQAQVWDSHLASGNPDKFLFPAFPETARSRPVRLRADAEPGTVTEARRLLRADAGATCAALIQR